MPQTVHERAATPLDGKRGPQKSRTPHRERSAQRPARQAMDTAMNASKKINTPPAMGNTMGIIGTMDSTTSSGWWAGVWRSGWDMEAPGGKQGEGLDFSGSGFVRAAHGGRPKRLQLRQESSPAQPRWRWMVVSLAARGVAARYEGMVLWTLRKLDQWCDFVGAALPRCVGWRWPANCATSRSPARHLCWAYPAPSEYAVTGCLGCVQAR